MPYFIYFNINLCQLKFETDVNYVISQKDTLRIRGNKIRAYLSVLKMYYGASKQARKQRD